MSVRIATKPMGFCPCGLQVEPGEQFAARGGIVLHVGCENRAQNAENAPSLFCLTSAPTDLEPKKPAERVFAPVRLDSQTDVPRLAGQLRRAYDLMSDGEWWTLTGLAKQLGCLETSAGSRIRDLRKPQHGGHMVLCQLRSDGSGLREYRLVLNGNKGALDAA